MAMFKNGLEQLARVQLKMLRFYERMSEETIAFSATVYLDGKKIAEAQNDGHGGCTFLTPLLIRGKSTAPLITSGLTEIAEAIVCSRRADDETITACCDASVGMRYQMPCCSHCERLITGFMDGPGAYVVDALVEIAYEKKQNEKAERKLVKIDAQENAKNAARGCLTLRWTAKKVDRLGYRKTVWSAIKPGQTPDEVGREIDAEQKIEGEWKVVS